MAPKKTQKRKSSPLSARLSEVKGRVKALETKTADLEVALGKLEKAFYEKMARDIHGPSVPPPPELPGPKDPGKSD